MSSQPAELGPMDSCVLCLISTSIKNQTLRTQYACNSNYKLASPNILRGINNWIIKCLISYTFEFWLVYNIKTLEYMKLYESTEIWCTLINLEPIENWSSMRNDNAWKMQCGPLLRLVRIYDDGWTYLVEKDMKH